MKVEKFARLLAEITGALWSLVAALRGLFELV